MGENKKSDLKMKALREEGALNHRANQVKEMLFHEDDFFDPRDLVQVKYEMIRKVKTDSCTVSQSAATFGLSRFSYYKACSAFEQKGIPGLISKKPGPRGGHKITKEIMASIEEMYTHDPKIKPMEVKKEVKNRFGVEVHRRSIERSLTRVKKKQK